MEPQTAKECLEDKYGKGYKLGLRKAYTGTKAEAYAVEKEHACYRLTDVIGQSHAAGSSKGAPYRRTAAEEIKQAEGRHIGKA